MSLQEELRGPPPAFALKRSEKRRLPRRNEVKAGRTIAESSKRFKDYGLAG